VRTLAGSSSSTGWPSGPTAGIPSAAGSPGACVDLSTGGTELELAASGVWRCRRSKGDEPPCIGTTQAGHWSVDDNTVTFDSPTSTKVAELLVFRYRGSYRLVHNFGDPDDWDYSLDFERVGR